MLSFSVKIFCMNKKKAIIFDFDGTLIDTTELENKSMLYAINKYSSLNMSEEELFSNYGPTEKGIIKKFVDPTYFDNIYADFLNYYSKLSKDAKIPFVIIKTLINLKNKGVSLFLVTGRSKDTLDISLKDNKMTNFFIKEYTGSDTGINKDISINTLLKEFNLTNNEVLYIGDTIADINTMKKIDVDILSVSYYHDKEYQEKLSLLNNGKVVTDIDELESYINLYI